MDTISSSRTWEMGCFTSLTHRIKWDWCIYLHLVDVYGKCWYNYKHHTWILWVYKCEWVLLGFIKVEISNWIFRGIVEQSDLSFTSGFFFRMAFIAMKNLPRTIYRYMNIYPVVFFATGIPIVQAGFHGMSDFFFRQPLSWMMKHRSTWMGREYATVAVRWQKGFEVDGKSAFLPGTL